MEGILVPVWEKNFRNFGTTSQNNMKVREAKMFFYHTKLQQDVVTWKCWWTNPVKLEINLGQITCTLILIIFLSFCLSSNIFLSAI